MQQQLEPVTGHKKNSLKYHNNIKLIKLRIINIFIIIIIIIISSSSRISSSCSSCSCCSIISSSSRSSSIKNHTDVVVHLHKKEYQVIALSVKSVLSQNPKTDNIFVDD